MKKENVLQSVQSSVSSIFSKDDVINLINSIEQEQQTNHVYDMYDVIKKLQDLQESINYNLQNLNSDEVVDYDSVEFSISYNNRIEVECMNINVDNLTEIVERGIDELIDELRVQELNKEVESSEYIPVQENEL